jgi:conjugative transfer pilus assembly protein TraH
VQTKVINNQQVSDEELRIINFIGIPTILESLYTFETPEGYSYIQDMSSVAATSLVINMLRQVEAKVTTMSIPVEALASRKDDLNRMVDNLHKQVDAANKLSRDTVGSDSEVISTWDDRRIKRQAYAESKRSQRN